MSNRGNRNNQYGRVSMNDLDAFKDLEWEHRMLESLRDEQPRRQRQVNLTSKIEEYIRSYQW